MQLASILLWYRYIIFEKVIDPGPDPLKKNADPQPCFRQLLHLCIEYPVRAIFAWSCPFLCAGLASQLWGPSPQCAAVQWTLQPKQRKQIWTSQIFPRLTDKAMKMYIMNNCRYSCLAKVWQIAILRTEKYSGLQRCGSGILIWNEQPWSYFLELRNNFFGVKYLNSLMRIRDTGWKNSDPGWKKSRIGDKHPGSATLMV